MFKTLWQISKAILSREPREQHRVKLLETAFFDLAVSRMYDAAQEINLGSYAHAKSWEHAIDDTCVIAERIGLNHDDMKAAAYQQLGLQQCGYCKLWVEAWDISPNDRYGMLCNSRHLTADKTE